MTLQPTRADAAAAETLGEGRAPLAATSLDAALGWATARASRRGSIFGLTAAPPVALLVAAARPAPSEPRAISSGKTVGIPAPGTPEHLALYSLLAPTTACPSARSRSRASASAGLAHALVAGDGGRRRGRRPVDHAGSPRRRRVAVLADLRQPAGRERWLGGETVNAAVFLRAEAKLGTAELAPVARALLAAVARVRTATPEALAAALPSSVVGHPDDFAARLGGRPEHLPRATGASARRCSSEPRRRPRAVPDPAKVKLPRISRLLFLEPLVTRSPAP